MHRATISTSQNKDLVYQSCFLVLFGGASYTTQGHVWLSCDLKCVMWGKIEEIFIFLLTIEKVEIAI